MFKYLSFTFIFFSTLSICISQSTAINGDEKIEALIKDHSIIGVSSACSINGEIQWKHSMGYSDQENKVAFTDTTITRIASLAKPMTAIAIMQLVEKGLLDLDKPIQTYVPNFPPKHKITTRMLLSHTSGIEGYKNGKEANNNITYPRLSDAMKVFVDRKLAFEPGTEFLYTSYGYVVLGVIIENVTGLQYEDYMKENIWDVAEMRNTAVEQANKIYENKSKIYHLNKNTVETITDSDLSNRVPGGGFSSTLEDLMKFGDAVVNHKLISEETLQKMTQVSFNKEGNQYSFGWFLHGSKNDVSAVIGHGGAQHGANTQIFIIPKTKTVSVTLANTSGTGNVVTMQAFDLLQQCIVANKEK